MENNALNSTQPPLPVWWLIWGGIITAFFVVLGIFESGEVQIDAPAALALIAIVPFAGSAAVRFLLIPRAPAGKKFVFFVLGLALAESGGFLALLLASPWKTPLTASAIVLMILHIPAFIRRTQS